MNSPKISLIAALSKNNVIGKEGKLPWYIGVDLKRFKKLTSNHVIVMGRKTYESIGKPLPNRTNIIVTRDSGFRADGCLVVNSLEQALKIAKSKEQNGEVFIIGGGQIYAQSMNLADKLYLTIVDKDIEGDVYFPDYTKFNKIVYKEELEDNGIKIYFIDLEKTG